MNGFQLQSLIADSWALREQFRGIFARDTMSQLETLIPGGYLCNTSDRDRRGRHWTAYYKKQASGSRDDSFFFDSLGHPPGHYGILLSGEGDDVSYNPRRVQSEDSSSCGLYCVFFLHWASLECDYQQILDIFSGEDFIKNELILSDFIKYLKRFKTR